jgi:DNA-directed RNA polymerase subunit F
MDENKVIEMKPVSLAHVKEVLKEKMSEKELNYEQDVTMKYVEKFAKLTKKQTEDLLKELSKIEFLKELEEVKYQILAALPTNFEQVKLFLPKDVTVTDDELKQVVTLTKKFGDKI